MRFVKWNSHTNSFCLIGFFFIKPNNLSIKLKLDKVKNCIVLGVICEIITCQTIYLEMKSDFSLLYEFRPVKEFESLLPLDLKSARTSWSVTWEVVFLGTPTRSVATGTWTRIIVAFIYL